MARRLIFGALLLVAGCVAAGGGTGDKRGNGAGDTHCSPATGQNLYFDSASRTAGQSCATVSICRGWTGPKEEINQGGAVYPGAVHDGSATASRQVRLCDAEPVLHYDAKEELFIGGNFWMAGRPVAVGRTGRRASQGRF